MQVEHHNFKVLIWRLGKDFEGYGLGILNMKIKCIWFTTIVYSILHCVK